MEPVIARKMWRTLEVYHGAIYFVPEAQRSYEALGITDRMMGYFGSRAAPMGAVSAEVVIATFFNFSPRLIHERVPAVWDIALPAQLLDARLRGADAMLRRMLGEGFSSSEIEKAAVLARRAAQACTPEGRPLYAGHVSLPWPDEPHLALWHAISLLREFRGDGHIAAMTWRDLDGCEALVTHAASGEADRSVLQATRAWSDEEWEAATDRLRKRGWLEADGSFTARGAGERQGIEDDTDRLALRPWEALGEDDCTELRRLVRPFSKAIVDGGAFTL